MADIDTAEPPVLTADEFERFRSFFYRKTGIRFEENKRYFVDKRIEARIRVSGHENFRAYFMALRFEAAQDELQALTNLLTTNETYFFREEYQFRAMTREALADVIRRKRQGEVIRIWSIPCSTGEEPYSIAIQLLENWPGIADWDVEILGSDIDTNVLGKARWGVFGKRSVAQLPAALRQKYFEPLTTGDYQICDMLRRSVRFERVNITDAAETAAFGGIDIIFCRNMLIYFDDASRREAVETLYGTLRPGGFIFLGHSESMSRMSGLFQIRKFQDAIAYQRPLADNGGR